MFPLTSRGRALDTVQETLDTYDGITPTHPLVMRGRQDHRIPHVARPGSGTPSAPSIGGRPSLWPMLKYHIR